MKFINKMRKKDKGFTLVEIIVVLVILAILAAFMIPAMLGFVGDANKKAELAQAREVYIAAQAIATEKMATTDSTIAEVEAMIEDIGSVEMDAYLNGDIVEGASVTSATVDTNGKVSLLVYQGDNGTVITFTNGEISFS